MCVRSRITYKQVLEGIIKLSAEYDLGGRGADMLRERDRLSEDLMLDSVSFLELVVDIEQYFGVEFLPEVLLRENFPTLSSLAEYVEKELDRGS